MKLYDRVFAYFSGKCTLTQKVVYANGDCVISIGPLITKHPLLYWFFRKNRFGHWLERRHSKRRIKECSLVGPHVSDKKYHEAFQSMVKTHSKYKECFYESVNINKDDSE